MGAGTGQDRGKPTAAPGGRRRWERRCAPSIRYVEAAQRREGLWVQPLTAPAVRPLATCRWTSMNITTTGRAIRNAVAITSP
jgi:hypothetical protein